MTTNCLMRPRESYKDRIYSTNVVGWEGVKYIPKKPDGTKDFSEIIRHALELGGFEEDRQYKGINGGEKLTTGFGHGTILQAADRIWSSCNALLRRQDCSSCGKWKIATLFPDRRM